MTNQLSSFRRFPTAFAIVAGSALAFGGLMASTSPAYAQGSADYRCTGLADQANTAADSAQGGKQASAKRFVSTGKKLCEAGNERAAAKQFRDFARADAIRDQLLDEGILLEDTPQGVRWVRKA